MQEKHKIVVDTNLWISFLLTKQFDFFDRLVANNSVMLVFSMELLDEFIGVAGRPKFQRFFTVADLERLLGLIGAKAVFCDVVSQVVECRDAKDNFLLALSKDSNADYLITGDQDLLVIGQFEHTQIITIADYKRMWMFLD
jgi:putative PIN family toxin of toxin-antitoxin system